VVSLEYRLHPVSKVLSGLLIYPLDQAKAVLRRFDEFIKTVPDELTIQTGFMPLPGSSPALFFSPVYCGSSFEEGEKVIRQLRDLGEPLSDQIQPVTYDSLIRSIDALAPAGRHYFIQTQSITLRSEAIDILIELARDFSSPLSLLAFHHFHGAASRVAATETAFGLRKDHLMIEIIAAWEHQSAEDDQKHVRWAQKGSLDLAPYAFREGYINLMDVTESERVPLAFGPNYERMRNIKRIYDPEDVFRSTIGHVSPGA